MPLVALVLHWCCIDNHWWVFLLIRLTFVWMRHPSLWQVPSHRPQPCHPRCCRGIATRWMATGQPWTAWYSADTWTILDLDLDGSIDDPSGNPSVMIPVSNCVIFYGGPADSADRVRPQYHQYRCSERSNLAQPKDSLDGKHCKHCKRTWGLFRGHLSNGDPQPVGGGSCVMTQWETMI